MSENNIPETTAGEAAQLNEILGGLGIPVEGAAPTETAPAEAAPQDAPETTAQETSEAAELQAEGKPPAPAAEPAAAGTEGEKAPEPEVAAEEDPGPNLKRGMASIAKKEADLTQRLQNVDREVQSRVQQIVPQLVQQQVEAFKQQLLQQARFDPRGFYKQLDPEANPAEIAAQLYYGDQPENAPPEFRDRYETLSLKRQLAAQGEQLRSFQIQQQQAQIREKAISYLQTVARRIPEDEMPYVAALAKEDSGRIAQEMYDEAVQLSAQGRMAGMTDEEGAAYVAQELDRKYAQQAKRWAPLAQVAPKKAPTKAPVVNGASKTPPPAADKTKPAPKTLSNSTGALSRPQDEALTHEQVIARTIDKIRRGDLT